MLHKMYRYLHRITNTATDTIRHIYMTQMHIVAVHMYIQCYVLSHYIDVDVSVTLIVASFLCSKYTNHMRAIMGM